MSTIPKIPRRKSTRDTLTISVAYELPNLYLDIPPTVFVTN